MKKLKNLIKMTSVGVLSMLMVVGCGSKFDASGYTKAVLDVSYKGETKQYMELTESTQEQADAIFEDNLDLVMQEFATLGLSDDLEANYRQLFADIMNQAKYTVGEAKETEGDNFEVEVTVEPITLFDDTYEEFQNQSTAYAEQVGTEVMNGAQMPSDAEMQNKVFEIYYNILKAELDAGLKYGEAETVTVHVEQDGNKVYSIVEDDLAALDEAMISMDALQ